MKRHNSESFWAAKRQRTLGGANAIAYARASADAAGDSSTTMQDAARRAYTGSRPGGKDMSAIFGARCSAS